ncbi:hypothetical protein HAX54_052089, partial [Datura stramonium]|nr:hypothetical protein [Datura stramonium]
GVVSGRDTYFEVPLLRIIQAFEVQVCKQSYIVVLMGAFVWLKSIRDDGVRRFANRVRQIIDRTPAIDGPRIAPVARWCSPVL